MSTTFERIRFCAGAFAACAIQVAVPFAHGLITDYQLQQRAAAMQPERTQLKAEPVAAAVGSPGGMTL